MKSYSAAFPMRGENFGDRLFASWHSAASFVCGNVKLACCFASSTNRHFLRLTKITVATTHRAAALMRGEDRCHCPNKAADPAVSSCAWGRLCCCSVCWCCYSGILLRVEKTFGPSSYTVQFKRYPLACGEDPSKSVVRFPVTKVPVSLTAALRGKVFCSLHGRIGSDVPPPYRW